MSREIRCLVTNRRLDPGEWYWYSWELEAPISAPGMAEIENRRHNKGDDFAQIIWEEWEWTREIGFPEV
jgi:hypothetical protein